MCCNILFFGATEMIIFNDFGAIIPNLQRLYMTLFSIQASEHGKVGK